MSVSLNETILLLFATVMGLFLLIAIPSHCTQRKDYQLLL